LIVLVGAVRFELTTPCAQGRCATRLRYAPTVYSFDSRLRAGVRQRLEDSPQRRRALQQV
jgi:hypothetical protein